MSNSNGKKDDGMIQWKTALLAFLAALFVSYMMPGGSGGDSTRYCNTQHGELLVGMRMLHHNLGKEAQLKLLKWIRSATFRKPKGDIERLLTLIHQTSAKRQSELEELWKLDPVVDIKDAPISKLGDSIQTIAENKATKELAMPNMER